MLIVITIYIVNFYSLVIVCSSRIHQETEPAALRIGRKAFKSSLSDLLQMLEQWLVLACILLLAVSNNSFSEGLKTHKISAGRYGITCLEGIVFINSNLKLVHTRYAL